MSNDLPWAKKGLGQHWLQDEASLNAMCEAAEVASGDVVLEIGPGTGTLTDKLIERGAEVIALELDEELLTGLRKKYVEYLTTQVFIQEGDVRTYDLNNMPDHYKIVANIPYYLTANLLRILTEHNHKPEMAALLVQQEVAERVTAGPGEMSLISVVTQFYYEASLGAEVPAHLFVPPPKVNSQILILKKRAKPLFDVEPKDFFRLAKAGFSNRRKTLLNSLSGGMRRSKSDVLTALELSGLQPNMRPQELSLEEWHRLHTAFEQ